MYLEPPFVASEAAPQDSEPAVSELLGHFFRAGRSAFSSNTARAIKSDLRIYEAWCRNRGTLALPASPETMAAFVDAMAERRAPATVRRYVASIAIVHRAAGLEHTPKHPLVQLALKRMHRCKGRRQEQAQGLTWPLRNRLLQAAGDRLIDDRDRALLAIAYDTLLRRGELVTLQVSDLLEEMGGDATLLVRRSKTDREGEGEIVWAGPDSLQLVQAWLSRGCISTGPLFRSVGKGGRVGNALPEGQVPRIFKAMAKLARLPETVVAGLSGHSTRVGAAQDMIAAGIGLPAIQQAGRWKSTAMVNRYGERLLAQRGGAAQLARIQDRGVKEQASVQR